jgi:Fe-S-cluster containining protein
MSVVKNMPEKLITEIPLIGRYSRHNEELDWRFRTYLKTGARSNTDLDSTVQEITDSVWKQIDCLKCANCCKSLQVVVDDKDIKRIAAKLRLTPRQFEARFVATGADKVKIFKTQPCSFLGADNKCQIYEDRPTACHDFPYLHKEGFQKRSLMMLQNLEVCPIVFNVWQELKARLWGRPQAPRLKNTDRKPSKI